MWLGRAPYIEHRTVESVRCMTIQSKNLSSETRLISGVALQVLEKLA